MKGDLQQLTTAGEIALAIRLQRFVYADLANGAKRIPVRGVKPYHNNVPQMHILTNAYGWVKPVRVYHYLQE